jgi:hypothetical protein
MMRMKYEAAAFSHRDHLSLSFRIENTTTWSFKASQAEAHKRISNEADTESLLALQIPHMQMSEHVFRTR